MSAENEKLDVSFEADRLEDAKKEFERALQFARELAKQPIFDTAKVSSRRTQSFSLQSKENIAQWLNAPGTLSNQNNLRNASINLYNSSNHYQRLVDYYAGLPMWVYTIAPLGYDPAKVNPDTFRKGYYKAAAFLESMNIQYEMRKAMKSAIREGAFYGVLRKSSNSAFLQQLDPANCLISSIVDGTFGFSYKMSSITDKDTLEAYFPEEFTAMYAEYERTGIEWQEVPDEISFCIKADSSVVDFTIPLFSSVLGMLFDIENYKALAETQTELQNYKVVTGEIPLNEDGSPKLDWGLAMQYYKHICNSLPQQVGACVAPFKIDSIDFEHASGAADVDLVSRSVDNYWSSAGTPPALHGSAITTSGGLKLAITADEMLAFEIMEQAESVINRHLKLMGGTAKFKIKFLPVSRFNQADMAKIYKEGATYGLAKSMYAATMGLTQFDIPGMDYIEQNISMFGDLTPMASTHTMSSSDEAGRPQIEDTDLTDEGQRSKDNR